MKYSDMPNLIDTTTGHYLYQKLRQCHDIRITTYSYVFNAIVIAIFVLITSIILYLCFTGKKSPEQQRIQLEKEQKYILEKIRSLKEQKQNYYQEGSLTHMPLTEGTDIDI